MKWKVVGQENEWKREKNCFYFCLAYRFLSGRFLSLSLLGDGDCCCCCWVTRGLLWWWCKLRFMLRSRGGGIGLSFLSFGGTRSTSCFFLLRSVGWSCCSWWSYDDEEGEEAEEEDEIGEVVTPLWRTDGSDASRPQTDDPLIIFLPFPRSSSSASHSIIILSAPRWYPSIQLTYKHSYYFTCSLTYLLRLLMITAL